MTRATTVNFSDSLPTLEAAHSTVSKLRRNSIEGSDTSSNFRRIRELETQNQLLKGKVSESETKYENLCTLLQGIVAQFDIDKKSLREKNECLLEQSHSLKAQLENLQRVVRLHNLQGEVNRLPTKPVALKPGSTLFQSPKESVLQSPSVQSTSARICMPKIKI